MDSDYLLGVHDEQRLRVLRFRLSLDGPFLSDEAEMAASLLLKIGAQRAPHWFTDEGDRGR